MAGTAVAVRHMLSARAWSVQISRSVAVVYGPCGIRSYAYPALEL